MSQLTSQAATIAGLPASRTDLAAFIAAADRLRAAYSCVVGADLLGRLVTAHCDQHPARGAAEAVVDDAAARAAASYTAARQEIQRLAREMGATRSDIVRWLQGWGPYGYPDVARVAKAADESLRVVAADD